MRHLAKLAVALPSIIYPFIVYWGLGKGMHLYLIILLIVLILIRYLISRQQYEKWLIICLSVLMLVIATLSDYEKSLKLYPVMVSLSFLGLFGFSLFSSQPIVERIARLTEPDLPFHAVKYTRQVTQAWCVFFFVNALISLWTVFIGNEKIWVLYNGIIAYVLIATMMLVEWVVRRKVRRKHA